MANFYDQTFDFKPVSSYVPLPLDAIMKAGAMKQQTHDAIIDDVAKEQDILKIDADPHRMGIANQLVGSYNNELSKIADEYIKNDNPSEVNRKLHQFKSKWANDQTRIGIEHSKKSYDEYLKDKQDYLKNGKFDPTIKGGYDNYAEDTPIDKNGNFQAFSHQGMYTAENTFDEAKKQMGEIAKDGSEFKGMVTDPKTGELIIDPMGAYWSSTSGGQGIKEPKVVSIAKAKSEDFLTTNAGRYFIDRALGFHVDYRNIPDDVKEQLKQMAAQHLVSAAANQIGWVSKSGNEANFIPDWMRQEAKDATNGEHVFGDETPMVNIAENVLDLDKLVKKDRGSIETTYGAGAKGFRDPKFKYQKYVADIRYGTLTPGEQKVYNGIASNVFGVKDVSKLNEQQKDKLNSDIKVYMTNLSNTKKSVFAESIPGQNVYGGQKGAEGLTKNIFGDTKVSGVGVTGRYINEEFFDPSTGTTMSGSQFHDDVLSKQGKDQPIMVTSKYNYKNPFVELTGGDERFASAHEVVVGNKTYIMSNTDEKIRTVDKHGVVNYNQISEHDKEMHRMYSAANNPDKQSTILKDVIVGKML